MQTKEYPAGFPLPPKDAEGNTLKEGDEVVILRIPDWLVNDLDEDAKIAIKSCEGEVMTICEVDDYGYMWVEKAVLETPDAYESHTFAWSRKTCSNRGTHLTRMFRISVKITRVMA